MIDHARHLRQVILAEIGADGQARLSAASAAVGAPAPDAPALAHDVASRYARGAGFAAVVPGAIDVAALAPSSIVADPAAREVLAGARAALAAMRGALGLGAGAGAARST
jgi:hypothetical protein